MSKTSLALAAHLLVVLLFACESAPKSATPPTFVGRIEAMLSTQCLRCHAGPAPAAGFRLDSWVGVMGCGENDARPFATVSAGGDAQEQPKLLKALDRPDHATLLSAGDREALTQWVRAGAPRSPGNTHGAGFADPRSAASHGRFLRSKTWRPMLDPNDSDACGTCHDGSDRSRRPTITRAADNAPACTSCHVEPGGVFACTTCHGVMEKRNYPPRDTCFYPAPIADSRTHAAHVEPSATHANPIACSTCHTVPQLGDLANDFGTHGNGYVDVRFDYAIAGRTAKIDGAADKRCTGTCHDRGGAKPTPTWTTSSSTSTTTCNDCHSSPPANHYAGACTSCHHEANATGTALLASSTAKLHINGKVDLGDGSGKCGACHGTGDDPWPTTGAHSAHANPKSSAKVACTTCHEVPADLTTHPTGKPSATVKLTGLAIRGGRRASFDATTKTCAGTYCHESAGGTRTAPAWSDPISASTNCTSCHSQPPPPPHPPSTACASCHQTNMNPALHANGIIDR